MPSKLLGLFTGITIRKSEKYSLQECEGKAKEENRK